MPENMSERGTHFDVLVLGGGTAGCALAGLLSDDSSRSVCLVEGGPDYGPYADGGWPADLLDAHVMPESHGWGFEDGRASRARVIGGCSSHNACMIVRGSRTDYDEWAPFSGGHWDFASIEPFLNSAEAVLRTRRRADDEVGPWDQAFFDAATELGYPAKQDFNDPGEGESIARWPMNAAGAVRWNAAFAYLDPARGRGNLRIVSDCLVDKLHLRGSRVTGVEIIRDRASATLTADLVILAAGAYGTPAILLRSGVGPEPGLARLSIPVTHRLDGVGENLIDHPGTVAVAVPSTRLLDALKAASQPMYASVVILKAQSRAATEWDLHLICWTHVSNPAGFECCIYPKLLKPRSIGRVTLAASDPMRLPVVDHGFLTDTGDEDAAKLVESLRICRRLLATSAMSNLVDGLLSPGSAAVTDQELEAHVRADTGGYYHAVGTCRMGVESDAMAVVDGSCRVHGLDNLVVADASVMPTIPRANTNLTVAAIAERVAAMIVNTELPTAAAPATT
jgi:choline dehydrogenase